MFTLETMYEASTSQNLTHFQMSTANKTSQ